MIPRVQATRVLRRMHEGVHRPPLVEADDGHLYVLKTASMEPDFPACELVASCLAEDMRVATPEIALVEIPDQLRILLDALGDEWRDLVDPMPGGCCFGSRFLGERKQRWSPDLEALTDGMPAAALRLFAFDVFVDNGDRREGGNPNALLVGRTLFAIDHGQALPSVQGVRGDSVFDHARHVAWRVVERHRAKLPELSNALPTDEAIRHAVEAVPAAWWADANRATFARRELRSRRPTARAILESLGKS